MNFFCVMAKIGDEMNAASGGALSLSKWALDLCMAPGGFTQSVLKHSPLAQVRALTLPVNLGGYAVFHRRGPHLGLEYGDIIMLHREFGVTEIPRHHPEFSNFSDRCHWGDKSFDLVLCDGQALRIHEPHIADYRRQVEAARLTVSQLILAMQRIKSGGTLILRLENVGDYETIKLITVFDKIAKIELFKPVSYHKWYGTFYLIAKDLKPGRPEAAAAVNEWKKVWKELTFPTLDQNRQDPPKATNEPEMVGKVSELLKSAERIIELAEPIWQMQKEALAKGRWAIGRKNRRGKRKRRGGYTQVDIGEMSTAATENPAAAAAAQDSEEDLADAEHHDDADTASVPGQSSASTSDDPSDSGGVSLVGMENFLEKDSADAEDHDDVDTAFVSG